MKPRARDDRGRLCNIDFVAIHSAKPDISQMCVNDLVSGLPKPEPWTWFLEPDTPITHLSAWSGERCIGIFQCPGARSSPDGYFEVLYGPDNYLPYETVPLPDFARQQP